MIQMSVSNTWNFSKCFKSDKIYLFTLFIVCKVDGLENTFHNKISLSWDFEISVHLRQDTLQCIDRNASDFNLTFNDI